MTIPTEPIGSIPRPPVLLDAMAGYERGEVSDTELAAARGDAVRDTIWLRDACFLFSSTSEVSLQQKGW